MDKFGSKRNMILFFLIFALALFPRAFADEKPQWKTVVQTLTVEDRHTLEVFFRTLLQDGTGGYVLFGEKPICIETIYLQEHKSTLDLIFFNSFHRNHIYFKKGYEVWKKLPLKSSKYLIHVYDEPIYGGYELIFANKKRVEEEVEKHRSLFQYVLGPKINPKNFIQTLENSKEPFYAIMKNTRVLLGILLGYGTENALRQSRNEYIGESLWIHDRILPLRSGEIKSKLLRTKTKFEKEESLFFNPKVTSPSFSFSTILEEKKWLEENHKFSLGSSSKKLAFPWFGYWDSKESEKILASYSETQNKLDKIIHSDHFLEEVFEKLFN